MQDLFSVLKILGVTEYEETLQCVVGSTKQHDNDSYDSKPGM